MKVSSLFLLLVAMAAATHAQTARNAAYLEVGGSALVPSVNYERRFTESWAGRIGASAAISESDDERESTLILPLTVSWISHPQANHHMEAGGGITVVAGDRQNISWPFGDDENFSSSFATGIFGYRYQKPDGGFVFRSTLTPAAGGGEALFWLGVSFGYAW
jgi:hypothetical protein